MKTPAGSECRFYYEDFNRGRETQECRLVKHNAKSADWRPADCTGCPVPGILQANTNPNLVLELTIGKGLLGFGRRKGVHAICSKHLIDVADPHVGCAECAKERPGLRQLFDDL